MPRECANGIHYLLIGFRFEQVSTGASMEHLANQFIAVMHREHQHFCGRCATADLPGGLDPVEDREGDVKHRDIRLVLEGEIHSVTPIARLGTYDEVRAGLE